MSQTVTLAGSSSEDGVFGHQHRAPQGARGFKTSANLLFRAEDNSQGKDTSSVQLLSKRSMGTYCASGSDLNQSETQLLSPKTPAG